MNIAAIFHTVLMLPLETPTPVPPHVILQPSILLGHVSYSHFVLLQGAQVSGLVSVIVVVRGCFVGRKQVLCCPGPIGIEASLMITETKTVL